MGVRGVGGGAGVLAAGGGGGVEGFFRFLCPAELPEDEALSSANGCCCSSPKDATAATAVAGV